MFVKFHGRFELELYCKGLFFNLTVLLFEMDLVCGFLLDRDILYGFTCAGA